MIKRLKIIHFIFSACNDGTDAKLGYPQTNFSSYSMTKIGLNALTQIQQKTVDSDKTKSGIVVSA